MACTPTPTATEYATVTSLTPSTSYSQGPAAPQPTTVVEQTCVASGTIGGSSIGCVSSAPVTVTVGGGGQPAQVPIVVSVPVTETQPTQTLFAPCTDGTSSPTSAQSSNALITTSVLVQSTPPPSTLVEASLITLSDGSVAQTSFTIVSTPPPTPVYVGTTSVASPTLQGGSSQGSGTNVAPIVGGVLGGFFGLLALVGALWWICRRRRSWDDIFEKDILENDDAWVPPAATQRERNRRRVESNAEPKPYQYGLVGHVVPPAAAGEPSRTSQYSSPSEYSGTHSRSTSHSAVPLLQTARSGSRPSTAGSMGAPIQPGSRVLSPAPRSMSMVSQASSTRPLLENLSSWTPNTDELAVLEPLNRTGSPVPAAQRRILQIVNDGPPSPTDTVMLGQRTSSEPPPAREGRAPESSSTSTKMESR